MYTSVQSHIKGFTAGSRDKASPISSTLGSPVEVPRLPRERA